MALQMEDDGMSIRYFLSVDDVADIANSDLGLDVNMPVEQCQEVLRQVVNESSALFNNTDTWTDLKLDVTEFKPWTSADMDKVDFGDWTETDESSGGVSEMFSFTRLYEIIRAVHEKYAK